MPMAFDCPASLPFPSLRFPYPLTPPSVSPPPPDSTVMRRDATVVNAKCVPCPVSTT